MKKPYIRTGGVPADVSEYPEGTYWEAGFLTTTNAGFRTSRPVVCQEKCTRCQQCWYHCPDGAVTRSGEEKAIAIDYDFCKGCGICSNICRKGAIEMEGERS